jgi:hypothetical protein
MPLPGLTLIGESINDSVPSTKKLFDENDIPALLELARRQDAGGADYIDINIGARPAAMVNSEAPPSIRHEAFCSNDRPPPGSRDAGPG